MPFSLYVGEVFGVNKGNTAQLPAAPLPSNRLIIFRHLAQISLERIIRYAENAAYSIPALNLHNSGGGFRLTKNYLRNRTKIIMRCSPKIIFSLRRVFRRAAR